MNANEAIVIIILKRNFTAHRHKKESFGHAKLEIKFLFYTARMMARAT